jgi:3-hydroxy-3-methylglutaryl CoA synthase
MIGLTAYAGYLPRFRLDRAQIGRAWDTSVAAGTKTVANYDEDALTMAVEAALDVAASPDGIDRLYFASTSAPYLEKQVASLVATACDLPRTMGVADFTGSVRAGTTALRAALDAVAAGTAREAIVTAADTRLAPPESAFEALLGDGAAAVRVGTERVIAEFVAAAAVSEEFTHMWRTDGQRFVQAFEGRFSTTYGYGRDVGDACATVLRQAEVPPERLSVLALAAPDDRAAASVAKALGCDPSRFDRRLMARVGATGAPDPLLRLALGLTAARPGDFILVAGHGEGADALLFRATDAVPRARPRHDLAAQLDGGAPLRSYEKYLKYRRVLPSEPIGEAVTNVLEFQELRQDVRLYGSRCEACGLVQYPMARVCIGCRRREGLTDHKLGRRGRIFTFTVDHLFPTIELPLPMVVVDLDGGGRLYLQMTDADPEEVRIGATVELCFRRLHEGGGNYNYYWKAKPVRFEGEGSTGKGA